MNVLCLVILLYVHIFNCLAYERDFYGEVTADELVYVAIEVPRYARYFEVQIWAEASDLSPTVLLRYDGLPTTKLFDAKLTIPSPPSALQLIDLDPTQSVLYLGLYGGSTLHRFRYFAGEATKILVGVETNVTSCPNEFQRGPECALGEVLSTDASGRLTGFSLAANTTRSHLVVVPSHSEHMQLDIATADVSDICEQLQTTNTTEVEIQFDLYLDQPAEENDAARQVRTLNYTSLCATGTTSGEMLSTLIVERPLPGVWTLESTLRLAGASKISAKVPADPVNQPNNVVSQVLKCGMKQLQVRLLARGLLASPHSSITQMLENIGSKVVLPLKITTTLTACATGRTTSAIYSSSNPARGMASSNATCTASVVPLNAVRTPLVAQGVYSMHASSVKLPAVNDTLDGARAVGITRNPFVVFEAQLPSQVQLMAVGGGLVVQVTVGLSDTDSASNAPATSSEFIAMMENLHMLVAVRFGGLPADPNVYDYSKAGSDPHARSPNAFLLSSRVAVIRDSPVVSTSTDDDDNADQSGSVAHRNVHAVPHRYANAGEDPPHPSIHQRTHKSGSRTRTFTWVITRPALPNLFASSLGSGGVPMFLRVSREPVSASGSASHAKHAFGVMHGASTSLPNEFVSEHPTSDLGAALEVSASVVFEPCPESSCVHGQCFTQYGDVPAYSCACTYPWAGESCDTLSVPYGFYLVQVLILTLSNLAMIPAVLLSVAGQLPFVATVLGLSASASGVYHLCDIDVYCLGGLSFHSLQVMDILFSIGAISCILLMYAPVTRSCHAALSLLCMGLLVPPVADLPTSPANLALSLTFALAVLALGWGLVLNSSVKRGRGVHIVGGMFVNSTTDPFLCDANTLLGPQDSAVSTTVRRSTEVRNDVHYASIANSSPDVSIHDGSGGNDVEMVALGGNGADTCSEPVDPADPAGVLGADPPCLTLCAPGAQRVWVLPALGLSVGLAGLMCFALQARESYYILHSMWHVFMMIAAYFLVQGRIELYRAV